MYMDKMMKNRRIGMLNRCIMLMGMICLLVLPAWAQTALTGTVSDAEGNVLPGVTVQLKGTTVATTTNSSGAFTISAPGDGSLVFSMIGYTTREERGNNRSTISVTLELESTLVDEVVVVGYNVVKKGDLTGSVVSMGSDEITAMPVSNPLQALQGRAAGIDVT